MYIVEVHSHRMRCRAARRAAPHGAVKYHNATERLRRPVYARRRTIDTGRHRNATDRVGYERIFSRLIGPKIWISC